MLFAYLHPGDLSIREVLFIFLMWAMMALIFVGLPVCLVGSIVYKVLEYRRTLR